MLGGHAAPSGFSRLAGWSTRTPSLQLDRELDGAVVGAENVVADLGVYDAVAQHLAHQEIVDAPASVVLAGVETVAPPAVGTGFVGMVTTGLPVSDSSCFKNARYARSHTMRTSMRASSFCALGVYTSTNQNRGNSSAHTRPSVTATRAQCPPHRAP